MPSWTVFEPPAASLSEAADRQTADRVVFVREKFSWWTLILGPVALLFHRLWLAFIIVMALEAALYFAGVWFDVGDAMSVLSLALNILLALELPRLKARRLRWHGYREAGVVVAVDRDMAERRFFEHWQPVRPVTPPPRGWEPRRTEGEVLGLFPEAGR